MSASQLARRRRAQMRKSARIHDLRMAAAHRKRNERSCIISFDQKSTHKKQLNECVEHLLVQAPASPVTHEQESAVRRSHDRAEIYRRRMMATSLCQSE